MQITLTGYADLISIHALREEGDQDYHSYKNV